MRHRSRTILAFAVLTFLAGMAPASAQHFIFDVPVDARNLPARFASLFVSCRVMLLAADGGEGVEVGSGDLSVPLPGRTLTERVRVPVNVRDPRHPSEAGRWRCTLSGVDARGGLFNPYLASDPTQAMYDPTLRRAPDAVIDIDLGGRL
jgi:hypothetical protein